MIKLIVKYQNSVITLKHQMDQLKQTEEKMTYVPKELKVEEKVAEKRHLR